MATRLADAVTANDRSRANFFARAVAAALDFEHQAAAVGMERMKAAAELDARASFACFVREALDQRTALDDQVRVFQRESGEAAVGEKFEAANFVHDAVFGGGAEKRAHAVRDDQRAFGGLEIFDALEYADRNAFASEKRSGEKARGGAADNGYARSIAAELRVIGFEGLKVPKPS